MATDSVTRFGDAGPDLLYSASVLLKAFPDARFVQLIRDGRDVAAVMLADPAALAWFKPAMWSEETEFPNPFLGVSSGEHRERWKAMPTAGKCALRWRSAVRLSATLHQELPREQLLTLRYEDLVSSPAETTRVLSRFLETRVPRIALLGGRVPKVGIWRTRLRGQDAELTEVAREELTRLGHALLLTLLKGPSPALDLEQRPRADVTGHRARDPARRPVMAGRQRLQDRLPGAVQTPAAMAVVDGLPLAVDRSLRQGQPALARKNTPLMIMRWSAHRFPCRACDGSNGASRAHSSSVRSSRTRRSSTIP